MLPSLKMLNASGENQAKKTEVWLAGGRGGGKGENEIVYRIDWLRTTWIRT